MSRALPFRNSQGDSGTSESMNRSVFLVVVVDIETAIPLDQESNVTVDPH